MKDDDDATANENYATHTRNKEILFLIRISMFILIVMAREMLICIIM